MKSIGVFTQIAVIIIISFGSIACSAKQSTLTIGFGSCANQNREQTIWKSISTHKPDLFIMMGDNIYMDTADPIMMKSSYNKLTSNPNFAQFRAATPLIATWDDHDFGIIDGGSDFVGKQDAKEALIEFFDYPEIRETNNLDDGIYHTKWLKLDDKDIQIIMLDTRWNRDNVIHSYLTLEQRRQLNLGNLQPTNDISTTVLGEQQWTWLESELKQPADLKIIVSSIQVLAEFTGWESWANFPHERTRILNLLNKYDNKNLIILSGDIHKAEISTLSYQGTDLIELTSSGLDEKIHPASNNIHKLGETLEELNYGILNISNNGGLSVRASIHDHKGVERLSVNLRKEK